MYGESRRPLDATGMLIRISIESRQPLSGSAASDEAGPLYFDGWLELLRVVSELVTPARSGGEDAESGGGRYVGEARRR